MPISSFSIEEIYVAVCMLFAVAFFVGSRGFLYGVKKWDGKSIKVSIIIISFAVLFIASVACGYQSIRACQDRHATPIPLDDALPIIPVGIGIVGRAILITAPVWIAETAFAGAVAAANTMVFLSTEVPAAFIRGFWRCTIGGQCDSKCQ